MQQPLELSMCFTSIFRARAEARSFHALEMPQLLSPGSLPRAPRVHPAQEAARPRPGIQIGYGSGAGSSCWFPGGPRGERGRAATSNCALLVPCKGLKSHPALVELGGAVGGEGNPKRVGAGTLASSPARQHPGDTGAPLGRYPACVDSCAPSREVSRRSLRRSADTGFWAVPAPGAPPPGGLTAELDRAPPTLWILASWSTRGRSTLSPPACPRRRPAQGGVNKRRTRFDLARPGFLAGVPPEQVTPWEGWKLASGIPGLRLELWFCFKAGNNYEMF